MLVKMICSQCGAQLEVDDSKESVFCNECGTKLAVVHQQPQAVQSVSAPEVGMQRSDNMYQPNLIINYTSFHPAVGLVVRIVSTGKRNYIVNGQTVAYRLPYGVQHLVLKIGKINYNRTVVLPANNAPVTIYASWNGRAQISIDQPPYNLVSAAPLQAYGPRPATPPIMRPAEEFYSCPKCGYSQHRSVTFCSVCGTRNPYIPS